MMKLAKKFIEGSGPVRFVYLFANALITDKIIKFIQATGISTRNWLQRSGRPKKAEKAVVKKEGEEVEKMEEMEEVKKMEETEKMKAEENQ